MASHPLHYITVKQINGRWMFVDPFGKPFLSKGVCHVSARGEKDIKTQVNDYRQAVEQSFKDEVEWAEDTTRRLTHLGFNTIGPWSSEELFRGRMYYITIINLARDDWQSGKVDDYFSRDFYRHAEAKAHEVILKNEYHLDKYLIGYCTGEEMRWGRDWRSPKSIVFDYLNFAEDQAGKQAIIRFFKDSYRGDIARFSHDWCQRFDNWDEALKSREYTSRKKSAKTQEEAALRFITEQYFKTANEVIRKYDPNHLILGTRFLAPLTPRSVLEACKDYVDVVSVNHFELLFRMHALMPYTMGTTNTGDFLAEFHRITKKPLLITEFGYRVKRKHKVRYLPAGFPTFRTDRQRGQRAFRYIKKAVAADYVVGWHLFQWFDQPPHGRFDGQNSHFGLVNVENQLYPEYARYLKQANELSAF
ncbi:MAG: hypothetical protein K6T81_20050 [Alicyclobacillus macrosporangiidus]|uniref:hypothetical protein n=1 Tax=Alicyclobacillus macrosporangiidus TaxID=392015 RepID=UPI0026E98939|nr:hypothetical protein [Alicyclobacillus macrosporangiidus]MCL6601004.1 hypothetical protein [Alicyclobacillus macrosporangiidus]